MARTDYSSQLAEVADEAESRSFLVSVYRWMSLGLAVTGLAAMAVASSPQALSFIFGNPVVRWGLIIAELGMVFAFTGLIRRVSATTAGLLFFAYAITNGLTLSVIFLVYTRASIASTFFVTAGTFAAMSAYGAITKKDLSSWGSFLFMGLIGVILGSVVNFFLASPMLYWGLTFAGLLVFVGLTAYDTQKIKALSQPGNGGIGDPTKAALFGALMLYLDFVNLFLYLLRVFGKRR